MISVEWPLASIFISLTNLLAFVTAQLPYCLNNGNYTGNSMYEVNLETLFSSLPTNVNDNGFYNASAGQGADTVYISVLCRGDVQLVTCLGCIKDAATRIVESCPYYKQAIMNEELCTLRYSNNSMFGMMYTFPEWYLPNQQNAINPEKFMADVRSLLDYLRGQAANGGSLRKVAAGNRSTVDFQIIFSLVQCTPDLTPEDCNSCLLGAGENIPRYCNNLTGCNIFGPTCNLRFSVVPFYNETRLQELQAFISPKPPQLPPSSPPPLGPAKPGKKVKNKTVTVIILLVSIFVGLIVTISAGILFRKRTKNKPKEELEPTHDINVNECLQYDFRVIKAATNDFSIASKLGEGGFGLVYKGKLPSGQDIAVKRLSIDSGQGDVEFKNEILLVAKLQHRNLVRILGFCMEEKERLLVYEFVNNTSLDRFIFDPIKRNDLNWEIRCKIIGGISRGLQYLHEESRFKIIHRDLKTSNILLDGEMNPKIADFGMARLFSVDESQVNTNRIVGTFGYMSPEYAMHGQFSVKSDVFSFGVLVLEIVSGQRNRPFGNGDQMEDLLSLAWKHWHQGTVEDMIDPVLRVDSSTRYHILRCIHIGLLCVQDNPTDRPTMTSVVLMLSSFAISLPAPFEPTYSTTHGYNSRIANLQAYVFKEFQSSGSSALKKSTQSTESLESFMSTMH